MYRILPIGGKDYKLEYTIEAALYDNCTEKLMDFFGKVYAAENGKPYTKDMKDEQKAQAEASLMKETIKGIVNLPETALVVFHAGLLEHHGECGDNTIMTLKDTKSIVKQYFQEQIESGKNNFYDLLCICLEQMTEDGFFKQTGMEMFMSQFQKAIMESEGKTNLNRAARRAKAKNSGKQS